MKFLFYFINNTPLIIAANHGYLDVFDVLINNKNINVNLSNADNVFYFDIYRTALHEAALNGYEKIVKILLNRKDTDYLKTDRNGILF